MPARSSWKGFLKLSLVSLPVKAYTATSSGGGEIRLNQLHAECHSRIKYKKTCPIHAEVSQGQLRKGQQVTKASAFEEEAPKQASTPEELKLIKTLIDAATDKKFDMSRYKDTYTEKLTALIEAKIQGKEIVAPPMQEHPQIINLMDALK